MTKMRQEKEGQQPRKIRAKIYFLDGFLLKGSAEKASLNFWASAT